MAVVLKTVESYDRGLIKDELHKALRRWGGLDSLLLDKDRILLKPNFVMPEIKDGASTTHPDFYMAVAEMLLELGKDVTIGESPAFGTAHRAVRLHGVFEECRERGVSILTFSKNRSFQGIDGHPKYGELSIAAELKHYDAIINLPKLKVHQQFVFSGATKNLYGCVTGKRKAYRHFVSGNDLLKFSEMIHMNANEVSPILNVADGIDALHMHGPRGGDPFPLKRIIVSDSHFELDWLFAHMIGLEPAETPLFAVSTQNERDDYARACEAILRGDLMPDITGFQQSKVTDIEFSFSSMVRSVWKSLKAKLAV